MIIDMIDRVVFAYGIIEEKWRQGVIINLNNINMTCCFLFLVIFGSYSSMRVNNNTCMKKIGNRKIFFHETIIIIIYGIS